MRAHVESPSQATCRTMSNDTGGLLGEQPGRAMRKAEKARSNRSVDTSAALRAGARSDAMVSDATGAALECHLQAHAQRRCSLLMRPPLACVTFVREAAALSSAGLRDLLRRGSSPCQGFRAVRAAAWSRTDVVRRRVGDAGRHRLALRAWTARSAPGSRSRRRWKWARARPELGLGPEVLVCVLDGARRREQA